MRPPSPLPSALQHAPFDPYRARELGVSRDRLRASDLDRSVFGVRSVEAASTTAERCALFAHRLLPHAVFSHMTAALLWRMPVPVRALHDPLLDITLPAPRRAPHASGIRGHRLALGEQDVVTLDGLRVTSAARTWLDLAEALRLTELVAAGDFLIHWRWPLVDRDELGSRVAAGGGRRGIRVARTALDLLSDRAESPPESELRVIIVTAGLPVPVVNHAFVSDASGGHARVDLEFVEWGLVLEYMGDWHREKAQWRKDMTRRSRIETATDKAFMELNADDLRDPVELIARIRAALRRRGWRG